MLIYRGWGILALLIPICMILIGISLFGKDGNSSFELFLYSLLCSAPVIFITGVLLNRKSQHDLYNIKLQYWGIAFGVIAITLLIFKIWL
jgi:hypothetical protein